MAHANIGHTVVHTELPPIGFAGLGKMMRRRFQLRIRIDLVRGVGLAIGIALGYLILHPGAGWADHFLRFWR